MSRWGWWPLLLACRPGTGFDGTLSERTLGPETPIDTADGPTEHGVPTTIYAVQQGLFVVGTEVAVSGVVTGVAGDGVYIQDPGGGGYSGVFVRLGLEWSLLWGELREGQVVAVVGGVSETSAGVTEVDLEVSPYPSVEVTGGMPIPSPEVLTPEFLSIDAERWEGVLVAIEEVYVSQTSTKEGRFEVSDGLAVVAVDHGLYQYRGFESLVPGLPFDEIHGLLSEGAGSYWLLPRRGSDVVVHVPGVLINEVFPEPMTAVDANCDGVAFGSQDTFVELWNLGGTEAFLDGAALIFDGGSTVHVFGTGSRIPPGASAVLFGGGDPFSASPRHPWCGVSDPVFRVSTGGLDLASTGRLGLFLPTGETVDLMEWWVDPTADSTSVVRVPDHTPGGAVELHSSEAGSVYPISPGAPTDAFGPSRSTGSLLP